jgi:HEAT repeat protein
MSLADEVDVQIQALLSPHGHEADRRAHDQALAFLLAHADEAHPRLLALLDPAQSYVPVAAVNSLPLFGRADSLPVLEKLMREGAELISMSAGQALGRHPHAEALPALLRGLKHDRDETKVSAADGLLTRGDNKACQALRKLLNDPGYEVRYHAINAAGKLGCLSQEDLGEIARDDGEADIRKLAATLAHPEGSKPNGR